MVRAAQRKMLCVCTLAALLASTAVAEVPLEGFIPLVGFGLTDSFDSSEGANTTFFISESRDVITGTPLGNNGSPFYDIALLDTGAATHILTSQAHGPSGFDLPGNGFQGANIQPIGGATGIVDLLINDPHGIYAAGLGDRSPTQSTNEQLVLNPTRLRGQTNFATLSAPDESWTLPNIIGMPLAAAHSVHIFNSDPVIFQLDGRTVRTPQVEFQPLGVGGGDIQRRTELKLREGINFAQGALYQFDIAGILEGNPLHDNPATPTVVPNSGMFVEVDMENNGSAIADTEFFFDTGASLTVLSTNTAVLLGIDPILDRPAFTLAVEGSGGIEAGIPGYFVEKLALNTAGGSFELENVPVAILDITNPADVGNIVPGILGMNVFSNRDIVIDANPSLGGGGAPPALYISDPVTADCTWTSGDASANWFTPNHWSGNFSPNVSCDAHIANATGSDELAQEAVIGRGLTTTVYRATIEGTENAPITTYIEADGGLLVYADVVVAEHGTVHLEFDPTVDTAKVDAQFMDIRQNGTLSGSGDLSFTAGPIDGSIRNEGLISPGDPNGDRVGFIDIVGDIAHRGTFEFDLGGTGDGEFDTLSVTRNIYLDGEGGLKVNLTDSFTPSVGDTFTIIEAANSVQGEFGEMLIDLPDGFTWDVNYVLDNSFRNAVAIELEVTGIETSPISCDADGDGDCDINDLNAMYADFGSSDSQFDFNGDGTVSEGDLQGWLNEASSPSNEAKPTSADIFVIGDANLDGGVDSTDLGILLNNFNDSSGLGFGAGDLNGDSVVNSTDLGLLLNNFNFRSSSASSVPEPGSMALLMLGFASMLGLSRSRR